MRLLGRKVFLESRIARRIFGVLLVAALAPAVLFGALGLEAFNTHEQGQNRRQATQQLKTLGLSLHDRLSAARALLASHAAHARWEQPHFVQVDEREPLQRVATLAADGIHHGQADPALVALAQATLRGPPSADGPPVLGWQASAAPDQPARVLLLHRDTAGRGWWLGEVDPDYLWSEFRAEGAGAGLCVRDAAGLPLHCRLAAGATESAGAIVATEAAGGARRSDSTQWRLFMNGAFGSPDWILVGRPAQAKAVGELPLGRLIALGAAATVVLAALLGLAMVRRTLVPLEHLIRGTRRLAAGERTARVHLQSDDEFGELAVSLNTMASHIEQQLQALEVQARVDRQILDGTALPQIMAQVLQRLHHLAPHAEVAVVMRDVATSGWMAQRPGAEARPVSAPDPASLQVGAGELAAHCQVQRNSPAWIRQALDLDTPQSAALCWVPATWRGETVALLMLCAETPLALPPQARQEIEILRDRVAIALAAAAREHQMVQRAVRDSLTGLLNRNGLHDTCDEAARGGADQPFSLIFIDLDGFKEVNDALGHPVGDAVLRSVAERLRQAAPPQAHLARPGGDEFVVLLPGDARDAEVLAQEICRLLAMPIQHRSDVMHLGASIGIACFPEDATDRDELLRRADMAMYAAKAEGRGRWRRYADAMDARTAERAWITRDLRMALDADALELHFQPRVDLHDGRVGSAEALVRWRHPQHGYIAPARFVPVAEDNGLIERLGQFVLHAALRQQRLWRDAGVRTGRMAVNVSVLQLRDPEFAARTLAALQQHGLAPTDLELEITESVFAGDAAAVRQGLQPLRDAGVQVALDDFGTGYSSLAALQSLPIDIIKIDRSFIVDLGVRDSATAVVRSVIALARALDKRVVAEGVETTAQESQLLALGCDEFQGYLYARPLTAPAYAARMQARFSATTPAPLTDELAVPA